MLMKSWDIWCDECGFWEHPEGMMGKMALAWAKKRGWSRTINPVHDKCPVCNGSNSEYWNNQRHG